MPNNANRIYPQQVDPFIKDILANADPVRAAALRRAALEQEKLRQKGLAILNPDGTFQVGGPLTGVPGQIDALYSLSPHRSLARMKEAATPDVSGNIKDPYGVAIEATDLLGLGLDYGDVARAGRKVIPPIARRVEDAMGVVGDSMRMSPMRSQFGMIGGPSAKTANMAALDNARDMAAKGATEDEIFSATGWWLGHPDGVPRFEIDDSAMKLADYPEMGGGDTIPMGAVGDMVDHPELYKAYPELADVKFSAKGGQRSGQFSDFSTTGPKEWRGFAPRVTATNDPDVVLHELQHAGPQRLEDMARGGSPKMFMGKLMEEKKRLDSAIASINKRLGDIARRKDKIARDFTGKWTGEDKIAEIAKLNNDYDALLNKRGSMVNRAIELEGQYGFGIEDEAYKQYLNLAGEAEARLVQNRMNLTPAERTTRPFYKEFDVPLEDQIVRRELGGPAEAITWHGSPQRNDHPINAMLK